MHIQLFEEFSLNEEKKKKKKKAPDAGADLDNYEPPEYVVQPAKDDTGFFIVKKEFEKMKKRFSPGISFSYAKD